MMLQMNITSYLDVEDDAITYSATRKDDNELELTVKGKESDNEVTVYSNRFRIAGICSFDHFKSYCFNSHGRYLSEIHICSQVRFFCDRLCIVPIGHTVPLSADRSCV